MFDCHPAVTTKTGLSCETVANKFVDNNGNGKTIAWARQLNKKLFTNRKG